MVLYNIKVMIKLGAILVIFLLVGCWAQQDEADNRNFLKMRRTACLVLSRYYSNTQKDTIDGLIKALPNDQQSKFINKLYAVSVEACEPQISHSQVQEFFVQNSDFDPTNLYYLLSDVNYSEIAKNLKTTKDQDVIIKYIKQFDEEMQIRKEQREAEKKEEGGGGDEGYQMKFLGFSIKDIPPTAKIIYVIIFLAIVSGAVLYAFSHVDQKKDKNNNKRRKSPKNDNKKQ